MAYLDGEVPVRERSAIESHVEACGVCTAELAELRTVASEFDSALALLDVSVPMERARNSLQREALGNRPAVAMAKRRWSMTGPALAKAAAIVLLVAGAASAAIPGTPLRRLVESIAERASAVVTGTPEPAVVDATQPIDAVPPTVEQRQPGLTWGVPTPASGHVRVSIHEPVNGATIAVRLVDSDDRVRVTSISADETRVRSGEGYMDVYENTTGLIITIPRDVAAVARATVEVDGTLYFAKDGNRTSAPGPDLVNRANEFVFQAHSR